MKKQIRLLIESLFDDEFDNIYNDTDIDTEITDEYMGYSVGDIYYKRKKPYAVCCGDKSDFKNNKPRFCLLNFNNERKTRWWKIDNNYLDNFKENLVSSFWIKTKSDRKYIDENGYDNTQIIKNNYNILDFPAFNNCIKLGDDVYLPAIDELQILYLNSEELESFIKQYKAYLHRSKILVFNNYWTSTYWTQNYAFMFNISTGRSNVYSFTTMFKIYPFLNIKRF